MLPKPPLLNRPLRPLWRRRALIAWLPSRAPKAAAPPFPSLPFPCSCRGNSQPNTGRGAAAPAGPSDGEDAPLLVAKLARVRGLLSVLETVRWTPKQARGGAGVEKGESKPRAAFTPRNRCSRR